MHTLNTHHHRALTLNGTPLVSRLAVICASTKGVSGNPGRTQTVAMRAMVAATWVTRKVTHHQ